MTQLTNNVRYLQIAFNYDRATVTSILPRIPYSDRILIEAGTPTSNEKVSRVFNL